MAQDDTNAGHADNRAGYDRAEFEEQNTDFVFNPMLKGLAGLSPLIYDRTAQPGKDPFAPGFQGMGDLYEQERLKGGYIPPGERREMEQELERLKARRAEIAAKLESLRASRGQRTQNAAIRARTYGIDTGGYENAQNRELQREAQASKKEAASILMDSGWFEAAERGDVAGMRAALQRAAAAGMNPTAIKTYRDSIDGIVNDEKEVMSTYRKYQDKYGALASSAERIYDIAREKGIEGNENELNSLKGSIVANVTRILAGANVNSIEYNNVLRQILDPKELEAYNKSTDALQNKDRNAVMAEIDAFIKNPGSLLKDPGKAAALAAKAQLLGLDKTVVDGALNNLMNIKIANADLEKVVRIAKDILPQDYYSVAKSAAEKRKDDEWDYSKFRIEFKNGVQVPPKKDVTGEL